MTALDTKALLEGVTPGPWDRNWWEYLLRDLHNFAPDFLRDFEPAHFYPGMTNFRYEADAALIASAPRLARRVIELEEALEHARAILRHGQGYITDEAFDGVRERIAAALKGEGGE